MAKCGTCRREFLLRLLDAKPKSLMGTKLKSTNELWEAGSRGEDFNGLECRDCYGAGWVEGVGD